MKLSVFRGLPGLMGLCALLLAASAHAQIAVPVPGQTPSGGQIAVPVYTGGGSELSLTVTGGTTALTAFQCNVSAIVISGALTANETVQCPAGQRGAWQVHNATSGAFTLSFQVGAGTPAPVPQNAGVAVASDGTALHVISSGSGGTGVTGLSGAIAHQWVAYVDSSGTQHTSQPAATDISGLMPSATTDTTNAANITSGTLPAARLPAPTTSTLGGIKALSAATSHQWVSYTDTSGVQHTSQPAIGDISGAGTMASQNASSVAITGGTIGGTVSGDFTTLSVNGTPVPVETAVEYAGATSVALAATATVQLSQTQCASPFLYLSGTLTTNVTLYCPANFTGAWALVYNNTSGSYTATLSINSVTQSLAQGTAFTLGFNGSAFSTASISSSSPCQQAATTNTYASAGAITTTDTCSFLNSSSGTYSLASGSDAHVLNLFAASGGAAVTLTLNGSSQTFNIPAYGVLNIFWLAAQSTYRYAS